VAWPYAKTIRPEKILICGKGDILFHEKNLRKNFLESCVTNAQTPWLNRGFLEGKNLSNNRVNIVEEPFLN
jgi:hypothetical protein